MAFDIFISYSRIDKAAAEAGDGNVWLFGTKGFPFTRLHDSPGFIEILRRFNLPLPKS